MKPLKKISFTALFVLGIFSTLFFIGCTSRHNCQDVVCGNGGVCGKDASGSIICTCPSGYGGDQCQTALRNEFLGNWSQKEDITVTPHIPNFAISIVTTADVADVLIKRYYYYTDVPFKAHVVDGVTLYIPPQPIVEGTIEGNLYRDGHRIKAEYNITDSTGYRHSVSAIWE